jgi:4,5-dihydroxyphthalate decarboxylase
MTRSVNLALIRHPHLESIIDQPVVLSDGATLHVQEVPEHLTIDESEGFDVWELPIVRYIAARERGFKWTAIPVFPTRRFTQWMIEVPEESEIRVAKDLEGRRVAQSYYGHTGTVLTKGVLQESYGVDLSSITWVTWRRSEHVPGTQAPAGIVYRDGANAIELVRSGEADAMIANGHGQPPSPSFRRLWADPEREAARSYESSRFFPIIHVVVVSDEALADHEGLAHDLYEVFDRAKRDAFTKWDYGASLPDDLRSAALASGFPGAAWQGADRSFLGKDPIPYGIEANREALERTIRYATDQGAIQESYSLDELFSSVEV